MKQWLILNYGGHTRIVNDIVNNLSIKSKPKSGSIGRNILTMQLSLAKVSSISKTELDNCLYSNSTMMELSRFLLNKDHHSWVREMTKRDLDFKNPTGFASFSCFKETCIWERNTYKVSRPRSAPSSPKNKTKNKSSHNVQALDNNSSDEEVIASSHSTNYHNKQWYPANLKFPCPLGNRKHEMSTCSEFFSLHPAARWEKMERGKICYCCLLQKNVGAIF